MPLNRSEYGVRFGEDFSLTRANIEGIYKVASNLAVVISTHGDGLLLYGSDFSDDGSNNRRATGGQVDHVWMYKGLKSEFRERNDTSIFEDFKGDSNENLVAIIDIKDTALDSFLSQTIYRNEGNFNSLMEQLLNGDDSIDGHAPGKIIKGYAGDDTIYVEDALIVIGGDGDDRFIGEPTRPALILGNDGDDYFAEGGNQSSDRHIWAGGAGENHYFGMGSEAIIAIQPRTSANQSPDIIQHASELTGDSNARIIISTDGNDYEELDIRFVPNPLRNDSAELLEESGYISISYRGIEQAKMSLFGGMVRQAYEDVKDSLLHKIGLANIEEVLNPDDFSGSETAALLETLGAQALTGTADLKLTASMADAMPNGIDAFAVTRVHDEHGKLIVEFSKPPASQGNISIYQINQNGGTTRRYLENNELNGKQLSGSIRNAPTTETEYKLFFYGGWADEQGQPLEGLSQNYWGQNGDLFSFRYTRDDERPSIASITPTSHGTLEVAFTEPIEYTGKQFNARLYRNSSHYSDVIHQFKESDVVWSHKSASITLPEALDGTYYLYFDSEIKDLAGNTERTYKTGFTEVEIIDTIAAENRIKLNRHQGKESFILPIQINNPDVQSIYLRWDSENGDNIQKSISYYHPFKIKNGQKIQPALIDVPDLNNNGIYKLSYISISGDRYKESKLIYDSDLEIANQLSEWGLPRGSLDLEVTGPNEIPSQHLEIKEISLDGNTIDLSDNESLITGQLKYQYNASDGLPFYQSINSLSLTYEATLNGSTKRLRLKPHHYEYLSIENQSQEVIFGITPHHIKDELFSSSAKQFDANEITFKLTNAELGGVSYRDKYIWRTSLNEDDTEGFRELSYLPHELVVQNIATPPAIENSEEDRQIIDLDFSHQLVDISSAATAVLATATARIKTPSEGINALKDEGLRLTFSHDNWSSQTNNGFDSKLDNLSSPTLRPTNIKAIDSDWALIDFQGIIKINQNTLDGAWNLTRVRSSHDFNGQSREWRQDDTTFENLPFELPQAIEVRGGQRFSLEHPIELGVAITDEQDITANLVIDQRSTNPAYLDLVVDLGADVKTLDANNWGEAIKSAASIVFGNYSEGFNGYVNLLSPSGQNRKSLLLDSNHLLSEGIAIEGIDSNSPNQLLHYQIPINFDATDEAGKWRVNTIQLLPWTYAAFSGLEIRNDNKLGALNDVDTLWISEVTDIAPQDLVVDIESSYPTSIVTPANTKKLEVLDIRFSDHQMNSDGEIKLNLSVQAPFLPTGINDNQLEMKDVLLGVAVIRNHDAGLLTDSNSFVVELTGHDISSSNRINDGYEINIQKSIQAPDSIVNGTYSLTKLELAESLSHSVITSGARKPQFSFVPTKIIDSDTSDHESYGNLEYGSSFVGALPQSSTRLAAKQIEAFSSKTIHPEGLSFSINSGNPTPSAESYEWKAEPAYRLKSNNLVISDVEGTTTLGLFIERSAMENYSHDPNRSIKTSPVIDSNLGIYSSVIHRETGETHPLLFKNKTINKNDMEVLLKAEINALMKPGEWMLLPRSFPPSDAPQLDYLKGIRTQDGISAEEYDILMGSGHVAEFSVANPYFKEPEEHPTILHFSFQEGEPDSRFKAPNVMPLAEGVSHQLQFQVSKRLAGSEVLWELEYDGSSASDFNNQPESGLAKVGDNGEVTIEISINDDLATEGLLEGFILNIYEDPINRKEIGSARFELDDNSHADFQSFPFQDHALLELKASFDSRLETAKTFYSRILDESSGELIGTPGQELFIQNYGHQSNGQALSDVLQIRGGSGTDHFLGCVDRTLEELQQGQPAIGPIRGDSHDGYLEIQDFDPTEDLLILPFNSDQPIHFDGSFLSVTTPSGATDKIFRLADGGFALSDLRNAIAYLDTINNGTIPTYSLTTSSTNLNEGHQLTTALTTKNLPAGTTLHWAIHGSVDADDFSLGDLSGSITTGDSSSNTLSHALDLDQFTEGDERFSLTFYADAQHQRVLAETPLISINDSSRDPAQSLFSSAEQVHFFPGSTLSIPIYYSNNTGKSELSELIANIHFDSSILTPTSSTDKPGVSWMLGADDNLGQSVRVIPETSANSDGNPKTDSILQLNWKHRNAEAHSTAAQAHVATLSFQTNQDPITGAPAASSLNFTASQIANGYEFLTTQTALISEPFNLDIDGDNQASLYTDGIMIIRRLIGLDQCTSGFDSAFFNESGRHTAARVEERLDEAFNNGFFDFNQDGKTSLYSDGILLIRYLISPQLLLDSGDIIGQNSLFTNEPEKLIGLFEALEPAST